MVGIPRAANVMRMTAKGLYHLVVGQGQIIVKRLNICGMDLARSGTKDIVRRSDGNKMIT